MAILNFLSQFADDVESGRKRQTIRGDRKRPVRVGETLHLYTGLRTRGVRFLRREKCVEVSPVAITDTGDIIVDGVPLSGLEQELFAQRDGFKGPNARGKMIDYFTKEHGGLPFWGALIKWEVSMSIRGKNWTHFANHVRQHVDEYTVPQFGDAPGDNIERMTAEDCIKQIRKYTERFGKNQRGGEDQLRDLLKIAHYASFAWEKMQEKVKS